MARKMLKREVEALALLRMENAARTIEDFEAVSKKWDTREESAARKQRRYGFYTNEEVSDWLSKAERWFEFLDIIFCNPQEFPVLIEDVDIYRLVAAIRQKPKDILYLSAIRLQKPQQIAEIKKKTDRAIRKMKTKMIDDLQNDLCERLLIRIRKNGAITPNQRRLLEEYLLDEYEKFVGKRGKNMQLKHTNAWWVRHNRYEYKEKNEILYIVPRPLAKPMPYNPMKEPEKLVIDFLNVGLLMMNRKPKEEVKAAVLDFVNNYGFLGFMTALPTTPEFITYENVYFHLNHFIKKETISTEDYLNIFFPFEKLDFVKKGRESSWNIEAKPHQDRTHLAIAMTFNKNPEAVLMTFQKEYAERYDWLCRQFKDLAFNLTTPFIYYNDYDDLNEDTRDTLKQGMSAFGGTSPTYRIILDERPTLMWEFYSLMSCVQMMFTFMLTDENSTIRICKNCVKAFIANKHNKSFCSQECREEHRREREK